ncbi:MAG: hypothetical protein ACRDNF_20095 [Streptosporangiaceae bacterium]
MTQPRLTLAPEPAITWTPAEIAEHFPGWQVWTSRDGWWHAKRDGNYLDLAGGEGRYALHSPEPVVLILMLGRQPQPATDGWDEP